MEIKSGSFVSGSAVSPYVAEQLLGSSGFGTHVSPSTAYWIWQVSDTVGDAVDLIAKSFAQLRPSLRDKKTGEFLNYPDDHPVLDFMSNPRSGQSPYQMRYEMMTSYCVAGACYPVVLGNVKYEPAGIYSVGANHASLVEGGDGWLGRIIMSANFDTSTYDRQILRQRPWTYVRSDGRAETIQIIESTRRNGLYPQSPLERVINQVLSKYYGHINNSSLLRNGSRPGGAWTPTNDSMSQDQYEAFKAEVQKFQGPMSSGRDIVAPQPVKYESFMVNNRDLDFIKLIETARDDIFSQFHIPPPLVNSSTMTMNNYQTAIGAFYDLALLPRAQAIYGVMSPWLMSRYKDGDRYELALNLDSIDALKGRTIERQKRMSEVGVYSDNEIRGEGGDEGYGPEGDRIYKPATMIPVGEDDDQRL